RWRLPRDGGVLGSLRGKRVREPADSGGGDPRRAVEEAAHRKPAANRAAWALERNTVAPASRNASAWRANPCGSPTVPTRETTTGRPQVAIAGARVAAGSGSAVYPSTTSRSRAPHDGSAAAAARCSSRSVLSIIG